MAEETEKAKTETIPNPQDDAKAAEWRERREKELEGMAAAAQKQRILDLEADLHKRNQHRKELEARLKEFEAGIKELEAYRGFGFKTPDELKKRLEQADADAGKVIEYGRQALVSEVAEIGLGDGKTRYNPKALAEVVKLYKLDLEVVEQKLKADGKEQVIRIPMTKGADGKPVAFSDYLETHLQPFKAALLDTASEAKGTKAVPQAAGSQAQGVSAGQSLIAKRYGAPPEPKK